MHLNYHIEVPHLTPTVEELEWANQIIKPPALLALEKLHNAGLNFDKADIDQSLFDKSSLGNRMKDHFKELGLTFRRFCIFVGYMGHANAAPHCDAHILGKVMIARLNVPISGIEGARLSWWPFTQEDPRMLERHFEQWDGANQRMKKGFSYSSAPGADWGEVAHVEDSPGACWNHVEVVHKLEIKNIKEHRINITAEIQDQIPWAQLVDRLDKLGYIKG